MRAADQLAPAAFYNWGNAIGDPTTSTGFAMFGPSPHSVWNTDDLDGMIGPLWGEADATLQLQRTLSLATPEVVVKRGAAPTLVRGADRQVHEVPTVHVAQVVDTTAAGDSFAGAYLAARLAGRTAAEAAAAGNRLAACVVQHRGAVVPEAAMADLLN